MCNFAKIEVEMENVELNAKKLEQLASRLKAIAHPVRIAIIEMLSNESRLSVTEIYQLLEIEQAAASHHLNIMKNKGILESEREGKKIFYSLQNESLSEIIHCVNKCRD
jgi:DNA-binding transcriptional ArsR family regulator